MSSINRARSLASASVDAGPPTTSGASTRSLSPCRDEVRQRQPARKLAELWRNVERHCAAHRLGLFRKGQLIFVDVAERNDARQHRGFRVQFVEKDFPCHPSGAPGRQIERRLRQPFRIGAGLKAVDQPAIDQRGNDAAQERHGYWDAKNAHGLPDSRVRMHHGMGEYEVRFLILEAGVPAQAVPRRYATLSRNASSAASTASGVPTCIHTPSSRNPNRRSCSLARSNILVSENSPAGASANSDGDMIAAPA